MLRKVALLVFIWGIFTTKEVMAREIVPFANVKLNSNGNLVADYEFGPHKIIFCYTNTLQTEGQIVWPYKRRPQKSTLPIFLKTEAQYQGEFADSSGTLVITNTTGNQMIVSCQYGF